MTNKYAPKRLNFDMPSFQARVRLAVIDHNENTGRPVLLGELRFIIMKVLKNKWELPFDLDALDHMDKIPITAGRALITNQIGELKCHRLISW